MASDIATVARQWYEDIMERGDPAVVDRIVAPDCVQHNPGGGVARGPDGVKAVIGWYHSTFADVHWVIDDLIVAGDKVVVRATGESRYVGDWHGIPARGQHVKETAINIFRMADGKIKEVWFEVSDLDVAYQLGAFPPRAEEHHPGTT